MADTRSGWCRQGHVREIESLIPFRCPRPEALAPSLHAHSARGPRRHWAAAPSPSQTPRPARNRSCSPTTRLAAPAKPSTLPLISRGIIKRPLEDAADDVASSTSTVAHDSLPYVGRSCGRPSTVESDTDKFWHTYQTQRWDRQATAAWQERDIQHAAAKLEAVYVANGARRHVLRRLIEAGKLDEAKLQATAGERNHLRGLGRDTTARHISAMGEQRRELLQVRKRLERVVRKRPHRNKAASVQLKRLLAPPSDHKDTNLLGAIEQSITSSFDFRRDLQQRSRKDDGSSSEGTAEDEHSEGDSSATANV